MNFLRNLHWFLLRCILKVTFDSLFSFLKSCYLAALSFLDYSISSMFVCSSCDISFQNSTLHVGGWHPRIAHHLLHQRCAVRRTHQSVGHRIRNMVPDAHWTSDERIRTVAVRTGDVRCQTHRQLRTCRLASFVSIESKAHLCCRRTSNI